MALKQTARLTTQDALRELACRLDEAAHGTKGEIKQSFCDLYGWTLQKLHRELPKVGWSSGRARRCDAGTTSQDESAIHELAATLKLGVRKNGKVTMETPNARSMLAVNGREFQVSNSRLNTLLRQRNLDIQSQKQATPHLNLRSLHPNHVHLVDPSLCLLYYLPSGEQQLIRDDEAYKNKPEFIERVGELKVWRYVLVDHYSSAVIVRYVQSKGETQANLYDFLLYAWQRIAGRPFHGVPKLLVWDKGSANTSAAIKIALAALQVDSYEHMAGNPRAKGAVEQANNLVEKLFESRLKYEPVSGVEALNRAAEAWANAYNANRIPHYDSRLFRKGMAKPQARFDIWQLIREHQLRLLPDLDVCRYLLSAEPVVRKVRADLCVSFRHPVAKQTLQYDLRGIANVYPRAEVLVSPLIYGDHQVKVIVEDYKGDSIEHVISPIAYDEFSGMRLDAPVWGEAFDRQPDTVVETAGKRAEQSAFPGQTQEEIQKAKEKNKTPFGGLDAHTHLGEVYIPDYMDRRGTELDVPDRTRVEIKPLSHTQACRALVGTLGRKLPDGTYEWIRTAYPDGVPEEELPALAEKLRAGNQTQRPGLAAVK